MVSITFVNGGHESVKDVGGLVRGVEVADGVLHLTYCGGECAPLEHRGSYPLANIQTWREELT